MTWQHEGALYKLVLSFLGFCLHSGTDNVAYDATVRSQLAWSKVLRSLPHSYYISVVGYLPSTIKIKTQLDASNSASSGASSILYRLCGVDTSQWLDHGSDGLLSVATQEFPVLSQYAPPCCTKRQKAKTKSKN